MGTNSLATKSAGQIISPDDPNQYKTALSGDIVPRVSGAATANGGNLGTSTYPFIRANITTGYFGCGMVIPFLTYNGLNDIPQGWFPCVGGIVNETNYDALHGAGSWASYIGTSPLDGLYVPSFSERYPMGATTTPQDGSIAFTSEGNASNQVDSSHTHTGPSHNHVWYNHFSVNSNATSYDSGGSSQTVDQVSKGTNYRGIYVETGAFSKSLNGSASTSMYTSNAGTGNTGTGGSATLSVKPWSIRVIFIIRII